MRLAIAAFALCLPTVGCGPARLNVEHQYKLELGDAKGFTLPTISKAQKLTIEFTSSAAEVVVYVIKDFKESDGLEVDLTPGQILGQMKGKSGTFTVDVPGKTGTRVIVREGNKNTDVTLKVTNSS
jgi:hypothetical protein